MNKVWSSMTAMMLCVQIVFAQAPGYNPANTLFSISNEKVTAGEFVKVYQKTNVSGEADFSEESLRDYLDLYVNFRLKVKEAKDLKMDTTAAVLNEFKTYRGKLTPSYMFDTTLTRVAYSRMQKELHVQHILVKLEPSASPADTLKALNKAKALRKKLLDKNKKLDFNQFAADSSQDPSAKENRGELGWITTLQLIYPFETAAYNLKPGELSQPIRTQFGYHLIRTVESRPAQGTITVAHLFIKVATKATEEDQNAAKQKIDSLYALLRSGANWDDIVKANSQDKTSSANGGQLKPFTTGQMVSEFEQAAYALQKPGDFSAPVKTKFGWHVIKLIDKKPVGSYDEVKDDLKKKIENGPWKDYARQSFIAKRKAEYGYKEFPSAKNALFAGIDTTLLKGVWSDSNVVKSKMNATVFSLSDTKWVPESKNFTQAELADYIVKNQRKYMTSKMSKEATLSTLYEQFVSSGVTAFEDARLEAKYPAFNDLMEEYMNGILLFDLASDKVWTKAVEDTAGLKTYYEQNKDDYMGQEKAKVVTYTAKNQSVVDQLNKYKSKKMSDADILAKVNKKDSANLKITTAEFEKGKGTEIENLGWGTTGTSYTVKGDSAIRILTISEILPPAPRPLNEVKGYVVADYQEMLEDEWIADLKKKYPVSVNEQVLLSLVKK